jgi:hypothetical protein
MFASPRELVNSCGGLVSNFGAPKYSLGSNQPKQQSSGLGFLITKDYEKAYANLMSAIGGGANKPSNTTETIRRTSGWSP